MPQTTALCPREPLAVNSKIAADLPHSTHSSLEKDLATGHMGIPYVKAGRKAIYCLSDLEAWLKANRVVPTSQDGRKA